MAQNPYTLLFGKEPTELIARVSQTAVILESFCDESPSQQVYMITGVRGAGKTVFLTNLARRFRQREEWVVVDLNPDRDLLLSLAAKLSSETPLANIFKSAKINLSFFGLGLEVSGAAPVTDIELALAKMLESLKRKGKRVLILIDEAANTPEMQIFASAYQILIRQDLPVFLLMTGLYENIDALQNEKTLTFLYRAPKIELKPLNIGTIARNYRKVFQIDEGRALHMAKLTRGYSFAFQILGYFTWEHGGKMEDALDEYRQYLDEYVYDKIWSELSDGDRRLAYGIARSQNGKVSEIRDILGMETGQFNPYRRRLLRRGIISGEERGYVRFVLPLFEKYVLENYDV